MLKTGNYPSHKGSSDFQQFAPFRGGAIKLFVIECVGFTSDVNYAA
jgi:hypothetical protein